MIAMPAVDLRDGACVQLVGGDYAVERVRLADPLAVARSWVALGFRRLHLADLDAATGRAPHDGVLEHIVRRSGAATQVGGGLRTTEAVRRVLDLGAERAVVGTRAIEDAEWLRELATTYPNRMVVAADVRGRNVVVRGWSETLPIDILDLIPRLNALPLAGILVTAVHKEGQMLGTDLRLIDDLVRASRLPVLASGGIATMDDLRALAERGVVGAVIGMALYTGALDARAVAGEFGE